MHDAAASSLPIVAWTIVALAIAGAMVFATASLTGRANADAAPASAKSPVPVRTTAEAIEGAIVEFGVEQPGDLMLVDHSIFRAFNKGALGILHVSGDGTWRGASTRMTRSTRPSSGGATRRRARAPRGRGSRRVRILHAPIRMVDWVAETKLSKRARHALRRRIRHRRADLTNTSD